MSIYVSVVVPTYKRTQLLEKCLWALVRQDFPSHAYEIIIVDDAGWEETRCLVDQFSCRAQGHQSLAEIRYTRPVGTHGPAAARNAGWRAARGEIIAFTDDDCLPEPDWLTQGVAALESGLDGAGGRIIVPLSRCPTDYEKNVSLLEGAQFVTANCFYRVRALQLAGGFDERFSMAWREDSDLYFHLLELSCNLGLAPGAHVVHPVRPARWGMSIREQRKSMFNALIYKKYPQLYRTHIREPSPLRYYIILACALACLAGLLSGNGPVALLTGLAWARLTLRFAFLRLQSTAHTPAHVLEMLVTSILIPPLSIFWRLFGACYYQVFFF